MNADNIEGIEWVELPPGLAEVLEQVVGEATTMGEVILCWDPDENFREWHENDPSMTREASDAEVLAAYKGVVERLRYAITGSYKPLGFDQAGEYLDIEPWNRGR